MIGIFLDTETNGLDFYQNKILEIAFCLVDLTTNEILREFSSCILLSKEEFSKSNPQSLYINGFTYEMVQQGKPIEEVIKEIKKIFHQFKIRRSNALFICQNPSFDRGFFSQILSAYEQEQIDLPYHWLDFASMFYSLALTNGKKPWEVGFSKDKIAKYLDLNQEVRPHRAMNGVKHLLDCYLSLIRKFEKSVII